MVGWHLGKQSGIEQGSNDTKSSLMTQLDDSNKRAYTASSNYFKLEQEYELLQKNYDSLYAQAQSYVNTPRYTPKTTFFCNSYDYGMNSTSTTCY